MEKHLQTNMQLSTRYGKETGSRDVISVSQVSSRSHPEQSQAQIVDTITTIHSGKTNLVPRPLRALIAHAQRAGKY